MTTAIFDTDKSQRMVRADVIAARHHAEMARLAMVRAFVRLRDDPRVGPARTKAVATATVRVTEALEDLITVSGEGVWRPRCDQVKSPSL